MLYWAAELLWTCNKEHVVLNKNNGLYLHKLFSKKNTKLSDKNTRNHKQQELIMIKENKELILHIAAILF